MNGQSEKIGLAIVCNSVPPYRLHLHQRIAREMPEMRLWTVRTHAEDARWSLNLPAEIGLVSFEDEISCLTRGSVRHTLRDWRRGGRIIDWLKAHRIRAVVMAGYTDLARLRVLRWCRRAGVPCFISGDSNMSDERLSPMQALVKKVFLRWILSHSAGAMPFGTRGQAFFAKYGVPPERMFLFPLEPNYDLVQHLPKAMVNEVGRQFGLESNRKRLLYCGRLVPWKRPEMVIDAFLAIAIARPGWDLVMVGDGEMRDSLEQRVPAPLRSRVLWAGHTGEQMIVSAFYRACDVLVLPSDYEPWALVILEAVAAGMAVVSSSIPGASAEVVRDGVNGRIFPKGEQRKLQVALLEVTDPQHTQRMRAASAEILADWRRRGDPVAGLRKAMRAVGVLPNAEEGGTVPVPAEAAEMNSR